MELAAKLDESCAAQASECEERQNVRAVVLVAIHDTTKLLGADGDLGLFKESDVSLASAAEGTKVKQDEPSESACPVGPW